MDYLDSVSFSLSTAVLINFPRPRFAVLPVALGVELVSIGGTVSFWPESERCPAHGTAKSGNPRPPTRATTLARLSVARLPPQLEDYDVVG